MFKVEWFHDELLEQLPRDELIAAVKALRTRVPRPKGRIDASKALSSASASASASSWTPELYSVRRVALRVAYQGWDYRGVAAQEGMDETIEAELFRALEFTRLIESAKSCNFSRSGRTDKGVSAFEQVFALDLRSQCAASDAPADGFVRAALPHSAKLRASEFDYANLLNRVLPPSVVVTAWAPVSLAFDARFSTLYRTYRYYFFDRNRLDLDRMRAAARHFIGEHDFRNFCKHDPGVGSTVRCIVAFDVRPLEHTAMAPHRGRLCELRVRGFAFLWHQVRNMAAVLFAVGDGLEEPDIVRQMLDVSLLPDKPNYDMASDTALVLHEAAYDGIVWRDDAATNVVATLAEQAEQLAVRLAVIDGFIASLPAPARARWHADSLKVRDKYKPMLQRQRELSQAGKKAKNVKHAVKRGIISAEAAAAATVASSSLLTSPELRHESKKKRADSDQPERADE